MYRVFQKFGTKVKKRKEISAIEITDYSITDYSINSME